MDRLTEISYYQREFSSCRSFAAPISPIYSRFRQHHLNAGYQDLHGNRFSSTPAFGGPVAQPLLPPWYTPSYPTFTGRTGLIRRGEDNYHPWPKWSEALPRPPRPPPPKPAKQNIDKVVMFKSSVMQDTYVVLLADRGQLSLQGSFEMRVLVGMVYCFGHIYKPSDTTHTMYSPSDSLPLDLTDIPTEITISRDDRVTKDMIKHRNLTFKPKGRSKLPSKALIGTPHTRRMFFSGVLEVDLPDIDCNILNSTILPKYNSDNRAALFLIRPNQTSLIPFIANCSKHYSCARNLFNEFDGRSDRLFPYVHQVSGDTRRLETPAEWFRIAHCVSLWKAPVVVFLGQPNLGKSTLARFVVNFLLNKFPKVAFLECDVGQTEFTPSGVLSLNLVDKPITGAPFTHHRDPAMAHYFGDNTPSVHPDYYIRCVHSLFKFYKSKLKPEHSPLPLVVNTCGWLRDLGACIAVDVIRITSPTHIVRLRYGHETGDQRGLLPTITAEYIQNAPGFLTKGSGPLWKEINDEDDGEEVCDGQDDQTEPVHPETVGETTQMWESEENTTRRDLMKIFEISGFMDDDFSDGDDETDAKPMMEEDGTELPSKKRKISDPEDTLESTVPSLPSSLWRRVGRIEVCTLNCKQWSKRSANQRTLGMLSYFSRFFPSPTGSISRQPLYVQPSPSAVLDMGVYGVAFKDIALHTLKCEVPKSKILHCFHGSLVVMARVDESLVMSYEDQYPGMVKFINVRFPLAQYIGFAIVKHIDCKKKMFYISSPEPEEKLEKVNLLLLGKNEVPVFYATAPNYSGTAHMIKDWPVLPISLISSLSIKQRHSDHQ